MGNIVLNFVEVYVIFLLAFTSFLINITNFNSILKLCGM